MLLLHVMFRLLPSNAGLPGGRRSFIAGSKQDRMWVLEVTPLLPLLGELRLRKQNPGNCLFSACKCIQLEVKTGLIPGLNIEMSGFVMKRDEENPHTQVRKKNSECVNVAGVAQP